MCIDDNIRKRVFAAFDGWAESEELSSLSEYDRTAILVWSMLGVLIGQGLDSFYESGTGRCYRENIEALRSIGASDAAEVLDEVNVIFRDWDESPKVPAEADYEALDRLHEQFEEYSDEISRRLASYLRTKGDDYGDGMPEKG